MKISIYIFILFIICCLSVPLHSQLENDFQSWTMTAALVDITKKYTASLTLINRINDNITRYNDISFDWRLKRKFKGGLSAQLTFRHWTFVKAEPIYFFWYDLTYIKKTDSYKWINLLRVHHGLDWVGKDQADFLRWRNFYYHNLKQTKITPYIGYDLWFRFNNRNSFQNLWIETGVEYTRSSTKFRLGYRRMTHFNNQPGWKRHAIVTGVFYNFSHKTPKNKV